MMSENLIRESLGILMIRYNKLKKRWDAKPQDLANLRLEIKVLQEVLNG